MKGCNNKKVLIFIALFLVLLLLAEALAPSYALARAGGGHSSSSGGSRSSGGSSSSSGSHSSGGSSSGGGPIFFGGPMGRSSGGSMVGLIVMLLIFGVIGTAVLLFVMAARRKALPQQPADWPQEEAPPLAVAQDIEAALGRLKQQDPQFSRRAFIDAVNTIFFHVQDAWTKRNQDLCRPFISDDIYQRHKMQTDRYKEDHTINVLKDIVVLGSQLEKIESEGGYDSITVRIHASLIDYTIDEHTAKVLSGDSKNPSEFVEYWVFTRKAGVVTTGGGIVKEKKCPNCGAPLEINQAGRCHYCDVLVTSGEFDWVLTEIVQEREWRG